MRIFDKPNYNFIQWRWHAIALSVVVIGRPRRDGHAGAAARHRLLGRHHRRSEVPAAVGEDALRTSLDAVPGEKVGQQFGDAGANEWLVRLPEITSEEGASLERALAPSSTR
jgi:hypothetical protein